jgi:phospholipid transport system substrate-binding protein
MTYSRELKVLFALFFALNLTVSSTAQASEPASPRGAAELVEMLGQVTILISEIEDQSEKKGALRSLIRVGFNLDVISQFVLGRYWGRAKAVQRAEFEDLFTEYLVNLFAVHFNRIGAVTVVANNRVAGGDFLVQTNIVRGTDTANVVWRVRARDNEYRIIDILIDGISLALTHRSEFVSVIQRGGFEKMLQTLRKRTPTNTDFAQQLSRLERASRISPPASILLSAGASILNLLSLQWK